MNIGVFMKTLSVFCIVSFSLIYSPICISQQDLCNLVIKAKKNECQNLGLKERIEYLDWQWMYYEATDEMTDEKSITIMKFDTSNDNSVNRDRYFGVVCENNTTRVIVEWNDVLPDNPKVQTRIDKENLIERTWENSNVSTQSIYGNGAYLFAKSLIGKSQLLIRTTPYRKAYETMKIDLKDFDLAIATIRSQCNW